MVLCRVLDLLFVPGLLELVRGFGTFGVAWMVVGVCVCRVCLWVCVRVGCVRVARGMSVWCCHAHVVFVFGCASCVACVLVPDSVFWLWIRFQRCSSGWVWVGWGRGWGCVRVGVGKGKLGGSWPRGTVLAGREVRKLPAAFCRARFGHGMGGFEVQAARCVGFQERGHWGDAPPSHHPGRPPALQTRLVPPPPRPHRRA